MTGHSCSERIIIDDPWTKVEPVPYVPSLAVRIRGYCAFLLASVSINAMLAARAD